MTEVDPSVQPPTDREDHRRILLAILAIASLSTVATLLRQPDHPNAFDALIYPAILISTLGLSVLLLVRPRTYPFVIGNLLLGASTYFTVKLAYLLYFSAAPDHLAEGLSETFFWTPAVFLLAFMAPRLHAARVWNMVFLGAMAVISVLYPVVYGAGRDEHIVQALIQLCLANLTCFLIAGSIYRLTRRHAATVERARTMESLAYTDPLTGLANRRAFEQALEAEIAAASRFNPPRPLGVLFMDLNGFKRINDTYGHAQGDRVLQVVAQRLQHITCEQELVARLSGDEFAVLVKGAGREATLALCRRVTRSLSAPVSVEGFSVPLSASIGVSNYPEDGVDVRTVLHHADMDMYDVKSTHHG